MGSICSLQLDPQQVDRLGYFPMLQGKCLKIALAAGGSDGSYLLWSPQTLACCIGPYTSFLCHVTIFKLQGKNQKGTHVRLIPESRVDYKNTGSGGQGV